MNAKQKRFLQWLFTTPDEREQKTLQEIAAVLNVKPATLKRWLDQHAFQEARDQEIRHQLAPYLWPILHILTQTASKGDFRSIKMILEILGYDPSARKSTPDTQESQSLQYTLDDYLKEIDLAQKREAQARERLDPLKQS